MTEATAVGTASTDASAESVGTAAFDAEKVCEVATATSDTFCACGSIAPAEATSFSASSVVQGTPPTASGSPPLGEGGRGVVFGFGLDMKETLLEFDGFILLCTFPIVNSKTQIHCNKKVCDVAIATSHTFSTVFLRTYIFIFQSCHALSWARPVCRAGTLRACRFRRRDAAVLCMGRRRS